MDPAGGRPRARGRERRSTLTANGRVELSRRRWRCRSGGALAPCDALLDAAEATVSLGTRELCCRVNAGAKSFRRAAEDLKHVGQVTLSAELLRQAVEAEGKRVLAASESGELKPDWRAADCKVTTPQGEQVSRVYLEADGFMAPLVTDAEKRARRQRVTEARRARRRRGKSKSSKSKPGKSKPPPLRRRRAGSDQRYKEFKLLQFHDEPMEHRLISVTRKDCREAGRLMRRDAGRIGFAEAQQRIGLFDAGAWILNQVLRWCVLLTAIGLDFFHLAEHVNQAKRVTFGEDSPEDQEGRGWAARVLHAAKHEGYEAFWGRLVKWRAALRSKAKRREADALLHYVSGHREMIRYDEFLAMGLRISSAPVESECRAVPDRVKGPGKRWDGDNAEAVMALEAMDQSGLSHAYWATCASHFN